MGLYLVTALVIIDIEMLFFKRIGTERRSYTYTITLNPISCMHPS